MSKHWVEYKKFIWKAYINTEFQLDPEDFLHCTDEDELKDAIYDVVYEEVDYGDISIDESKSELTMVDFINEWKSLKGLK